MEGVTDKVIGNIQNVPLSLHFGGKNRGDERYMSVIIRTQLKRANVCVSRNARRKRLFRLQNYKKNAIYENK